MDAQRGPEDEAGAGAVHLRTHWSADQCLATQSWGCVGQAHGHRRTSHAPRWLPRLLRGQWG